MASKYVTAFLASELAAFKTFLGEVDEGELDVNELQVELSKHCDMLRSALDTFHPPRPSSPVLAIPTRRATPKKATTLTRTPSGRALRVGGAGTIFKMGSGTKRRPSPDSDFATEAVVARTTLEDDSPAPRKRHLMTAGEMHKTEDGEALAAGELAMDERPRYQGTARRPGSGTKKRVIDSIFINH
jgi:hypothetical protein